MKSNEEISNMIRKMTGLIDREDVREEVANEISGLALLSEPDEFKELISRFIKYPDGLEELRKKWKIVYNNSKEPLSLIGIFAQDEEIRQSMFEDANYLLNYGDVMDSSSLAKEVSGIEGRKKIFSR